MRLFLLLLKKASFSDCILVASEDDGGMDGPRVLLTPLVAAESLLLVELASADCRCGGRAGPLTALDGGMLGPTALLGAGTGEGEGDDDDDDGGGDGDNDGGDDGDSDVFGGIVGPT